MLPQISSYDTPSTSTVGSATAYVSTDALSTLVVIVMILGRSKLKSL